MYKSWFQKFETIVMTFVKLVQIFHYVPSFGVRSAEIHEKKKQGAWRETEIKKYM